MLPPAHWLRAAMEELQPGASACLGALLRCRSCHEAGKAARARADPRGLRLGNGDREEEDLQSPKEHPCMPPRLLSRCLGDACEGVLWGRDTDWGGVISCRGRRAGTACGTLPPVTLSPSIRSTHGVLVEHQRVLSRQNVHGAPVRLAPQHSWYNLWNHTAGTVSRSLRSTQGVLVEHQRVLVTIESPGRAC